MSIKSISTDELRHMIGKEGLVLLNCGGNLQEWLDGINNELTKAEILKNGSRFEDIYSFKYDGFTCLLFPFENKELNIGKFAMWRLQTYSAYNGTWLSDFVPNRLGGYISENESDQEKPDCPLIGQDGNIYNLMGIASRTLREHGLADQAKEMTDRILASDSYDKALCIIGDYVNITSCEEDEDERDSEEYYASEGMGSMSF